MRNKYIYNGEDRAKRLFTSLRTFNSNALSYRMVVKSLNLCRKHLYILILFLDME